MIGGLLKSTSLAALLAAASIAAAGSAQAADLGGNCCADLEERIAELEATTARKGNRKVSLTVSGQINEAVMFWDDGVESNINQVTNETYRGRFRFVGNAKIDANWSAGYLLEIGYRGGRQDQTSQLTDEGASNNTLDVRHSAWWLQHKQLGKVWVGQTTQAADGITEINLANVVSGNAQMTDWIGAMNLTRSNGNFTSGSRNAAGLTYSNLSNGTRPGSALGEGDRFNVVKYETPALMGFIGSASWGEDDMWDVALRYAGEFNGIKIGAGIAYTEWTDASGAASTRGCAFLNGADASCDEIGLSASIMHVPTGLYLTGAYGQQNDDNLKKLNAFARDTREFYYIQGGIEQKFFPVGKTTLFGEYYDGDFGTLTNAGGLRTVAAGATSTNAGFNGSAAALVTGETRVWGLGFTQAIDAAAMDLYVHYRHFEMDLQGFSAAGVSVGKAQLNDIDVVMMGAQIKF
jgi:hypothetical protein